MKLCSHPPRCLNPYLKVFLDSSHSLPHLKDSVIKTQWAPSPSPAPKVTCSPPITEPLTPFLPAFRILPLLTGFPSPPLIHPAAIPIHPPHPLLSRGRGLFPLLKITPPHPTPTLPFSNNLHPQVLVALISFGKSLHPLPSSLPLSSTSLSPASILYHNNDFKESSVRLHWAEVSLLRVGIVAFYF